MAIVNKREKKAKKSPHLKLRTALLQGAFLVLILTITARLYQLQILSHDSSPQRLVQRALSLSEEKKPPRGAIYDRQGRLMAASVRVGSTHIEPEDFHQHNSTALDEINSFLETNQVRLAAAMVNGDLNGHEDHESMDWKLPGGLSSGFTYQLLGLELKGIELTEESKRYFPARDLAAQMLGFVGKEHKGLEGAEYFYNDLLKDGSADLFLTIDQAIQYQTEKELGRGCRAMKAKSGVAIVMEVESGEILAIANWPTYNLNNYKKFQPKIRRNRCLTDAFEPGSVFKIFLAAAALEEEVVKPHTLIDCQQGVLQVSGRTIHDTHQCGELTFTEVIKESSNIGSAKIGLLLGKDKLAACLKGFGFGEETGLLAKPGKSESRGKLRPVREWREVNTANIAFGQGVSVTPLQLINAVCCLARYGVWKKPKIVKEVRNRQGEEEPRLEQEATRQVISRATSEEVIQILEEAVIEGTGKEAFIPGYRVAGKTGTAQKVIQRSGHYAKDLYFSSFVGFFPAKAPRIAILVTIDEPKGEHLASKVAAPVFRQIAKSVIDYLNIEPVELVPSSKNPAWQVAGR